VHEADRPEVSQFDRTVFLREERDKRPIDLPEVLAPTKEYSLQSGEHIGLDDRPARLVEIP
jgi:hypothetical protein